MATKSKVNVKNQSMMSEEQVNAVIAKLEEEGASLGAIARNFVVVARTSKQARYMLETIMGGKLELPKDSIPSALANDIKKAICKNYPYQTKGGMLLKKEDGIFKELKEYSANMVKRAFYVAVGQTKKQIVELATAEQVKEAADKKETRKKEAAEKKADAKNTADMYARFWEEMMAARPEDVLAIRDKYKNADYQKDIKNKIDAAAGK